MDLRTEQAVGILMASIAMGGSCWNGTTKMLLVKEETVT